jgi:hypothetical protein
MVRSPPQKTLLETSKRISPPLSSFQDLTHHDLCLAFCIGFRVIEKLTPESYAVVISFSAVDSLIC